jgi:hypothetical protein
MTEAVTVSVPLDDSVPTGVDGVPGGKSAVGPYSK